MNPKSKRIFVIMMVLNSSSFFFATGVLKKKNLRYGANCNATDFDKMAFNSIMGDELQS